MENKTASGEWVKNDEIFSPYILFEWVGNTTTKNQPMETAEEILDNTFREDCGFPFFGLIANTSYEGLKADSENIKYSILAAMKQVAELAFDAGSKRGYAESMFGRNAMATTKDQFIQQLFPSVETK